MLVCQGPALPRGAEAAQAVDPEQLVAPRPRYWRAEDLFFGLLLVLFVGLPAMMLLYGASHAGRGLLGFLVVALAPALTLGSALVYAALGDHLERRRELVELRRLQAVRGRCLARAEELPSSTPARPISAATAAG